MPGTWGMPPRVAQLTGAELDTLEGFLEEVTLTSGSVGKWEVKQVSSMCKHMSLETTAHTQTHVAPEREAGVGGEEWEGGRAARQIGTDSCREGHSRNSGSSWVT